MATLFTPLPLGPLMLRNRIARAPLPIRAAAPGGFVTEELVGSYRRWAAGGAGLVLSEPISVAPSRQPGLATLHSDMLVPEIARLVRAIESHGAHLLPLLSHPPLPPHQLAARDLEPIREAFVAAAWRARAAGCRGVAIHGAEHTLLHQLHSPLSNRRRDAYGLDRILLAQEIVEGIRRWLGPGLVIGYRLVADEFSDEGIGLHESRVAARRLVAAGVDLLDVVPGLQPGQPIARFPGWQIPLAAAIKAVTDVPVIVNGGMGEPAFASSVIEEGSADLVGLGAILNEDPQWPRHAARALAAGSPASPL
ncbi:MAG TPA: hypothetical protein VGE07_04835 [Herpetosiphonaceae bacterium]